LDRAAGVSVAHQQRDFNVTIFAIISLILICIIGVAQQREKLRQLRRGWLEMVGSRYLDTTSTIVEKKIWRGMMRQQLVGFWGPLLRQWRRARRYCSKVYLNNGIVVGWDQPR
jgi:hypothetical protein